jgi:hypothetical protein
MLSSSPSHTANIKQSASLPKRWWDDVCGNLANGFTGFAIYTMQDATVFCVLFEAAKPTVGTCNPEPVDLYCNILDLQLGGDRFVSESMQLLL